MGSRLLGCWVDAKNDPHIFFTNRIISLIWHEVRPSDDHILWEKFPIICDEKHIYTLFWAKRLKTQRPYHLPIIDLTPPTTHPPPLEHPPPPLQLHSTYNISARFIYINKITLNPTTTHTTTTTHSRYKYHYHYQPLPSHHPSLPNPCPAVTTMVNLTTTSLRTAPHRSIHSQIWATSPLSLPHNPQQQPNHSPHSNHPSPNPFRMPSLQSNSSQ